MESKRKYTLLEPKSTWAPRSPRIRPKVRFLVDDEVLEIGEEGEDYKEIIRERKT